MIAIYTDGSCSGNPGPGGFGVVAVLYDDDPEKDGIIIGSYFERSEDTTNNREEMKAIIWALEHYGFWEGKGNRFLCTPIVYSDSAYCVNSFTDWIHNWKANGWTKAGGKKLENLDLIKRYDELIQKGYKIDLQKIKGHAGIKFNELADRLATGKIRKEEVLKECND